MREDDPEDQSERDEPKGYTGVMWFISIVMLGLGGTATLFGNYYLALPGFIVLVIASIALARRWAYSDAGACGISLLLVLGGLALACGVVLAACSRSFHI